MMAHRGIDYAQGRPTPAQLEAAKVEFVGRYLAPTGSQYDWKRLTRDEAAQLAADGIAVVAVFESAGNRAAAGHNAGVADATIAVAQAATAGLPAETPLYFAVDFDIPDYAAKLPNTAANARAKLGPVGDYFAGAGSVLPLGQVGAYGGYWAIRRLFDAGLATWGWQTRGWSGGQWDPRAHIRQYAAGTVGGVSVDLDLAVFDQYGQTPVAPVPVSVRTPAAQLKPRRGYWAWVGWRLGEGDWKGWGRANPQVRPNVPRTVPALWWVSLRMFLKARVKGASS